MLNKRLMWWFIPVLVVVLDRFSKTWVTANLAYREPLEVMPFFNLTLAHNTGAAFSFLHDASGWQNLFLGGIAAIVCIAIIYWLIKLPARAYWSRTALCLILGGALGNAWDRLQYGYVIDFLDFYFRTWHFATFNIADSAICVGAFLLILTWIKQIE